MTTVLVLGGFAMCALLERAAADGVVTLTMNRPEKKNALSIALRDEITAALQRLAADDATRTVVITGAGTVFSAGFDLGEFDAMTDPDYARRLWDSSDRFHHACLTFPLPLIAAVNGPALAGGFDLATMCDLRILAASARFAHPERSFATVVYAPLHELVGGAIARDLVLTGRSVDANQAQTLGLANQVVPDDQLAAAAAATAANIATAPRDALISNKAKIIARARVELVPTLHL